MLTRLIIRNFVLINELTLDFKPSYTAITGETGSGKSILLNALGLIKGERADFGVIGPSDTRSIVEAHFNVRPEIIQWLNERSLEPWKEVILRREIHKDGKSRAFINDTPVTLQDMKSIGERLFIIHSQYNTLELKNQEYQLYIVDALCGTQTAFNDYLIGYQEYIKRNHALTLKIEELSLLESKMDYEQFMLTEILALNLDAKDYEALSVQLELKEENQVLISDISSLTAISESPMLQDLSRLAKALERHESNINSLQEIRTIVEEISARFSELSYLSGKVLQQLETSEVDEAEILTQVDEFNRILNKHRLTSQEALRDLQHRLEGRVSELEELKAFISKEQHVLVQQEMSLRNSAKALNELRKEALPNIEKRIQSGLNSLKLSGAQLMFRLIETTSLNARGMIDLEMLFSANKGMLPVPIQKAASGGELSRVMLLLQQLISSTLEMPSILFDEIDTGVSGDVAEKIGKLLKEMGQGRQLFAITHLPQVAAQAQHHLVVRKTENNQRIETSVAELVLEERVTEIARLMSGEVINDSALVNARNLMNSDEV
jgi:DNA repair protein RecN (Recombination protein N)